MRHRFAVCMLVLLMGHPAVADPVIAPEPALPEITLGEEVAVHAQDLPQPDATTAYVVYLSNGKDPSANRIALPAKWVDAKTFTFAVPSEKVPVGRYLVSVSIAGKELAVPGDLRVQAPASAPVHLDGIYPATSYPTDSGGFDFVIAGQHLGALAQSNHILVVGRGELSVGSPQECATPSAGAPKTCVYVDAGTQTPKLRVVNFPRNDYAGQIQIQVRVGDGNNVSNPIPLTISRVSARAAIIGALATITIIMLIVLRFIWAGVDGHVIGYKHFGPLTALFLDKETNTYSLSKFQLLLWTSVFIFGYVYVFLCRMLVQWKFDLPPIPDSMTGMLAISAGAAVAAAGATGTRGSKGSGPIFPSAADFVSTGGLVVGERFQYFAWTLVAALQFLSMLLLTDPASVAELPKLPDGMLYLMGVSSAGYLGGKVIRKPGPVIKSLSVEVLAAPSLKIHLEGASLANNATIKVDDQQLRDDQIKREGTPNPQAADPAFCDMLDVTIKDATAYLEGGHTLTLINSDGQSATTQFPLDPMVIDSVDSPTHGATAVTIKVAGKNFGDPTTAEWVDATGNTPGSTPKVVRKSDTELSLELVPGPKAGTGTLTLISAKQLRASKKVMIS